MSCSTGIQYKTRGSNNGFNTGPLIQFMNVMHLSQVHLSTLTTGDRLFVLDTHYCVPYILLSPLTRIPTLSVF